MDRTFHRAAALLILSLLPAAAGCILPGPTVSLQVELPAAPAHWESAFGPLAYRLVWLGRDGDPQARRLAPGVRQVGLECPRAGPRPFLAWPCLPGGASLLPPAGGVDPMDRREAACLALSWEHGPVASVLYRLERLGLDLRGFNVRRLIAEIDARGGADPWLLDLDGVTAALAGGDFQVTSLRYRCLGTIELPAGPGAWFLESPFSGPLVSGPDGLLRLEGLSHGLHHLFALSGGRRFDLHLDAAGSSWLEREPLRE